MATYEDKAEYNFEVVRGESFQIDFNNWQVNGNPFDFTGSKVKVELKREVNSPREPDLSLTQENGGVVVTGNNVSIKFGENTYSLKACKYYYDILIVDSAGNRNIYVRGEISMSGTVTK